MRARVDHDDRQAIPSDLRLLRTDRLTVGVLDLDRVRALRKQRRGTNGERQRRVYLKPIVAESLYLDPRRLCIRTFRDEHPLSEAQLPALVERDGQVLLRLA